MDAEAKQRTYKIGQAAKLLDVKPFVLRFWEGEFTDVLVPVRTPAGQRAYTEANIATVREIKRLLYDEGLTIEGAKKRLSGQAGQTGQAAPSLSALSSAAATASAATPQEAAPSRDAALPLLQPTRQPVHAAGGAQMPAATAQAIAAAKARGAAEAEKSARAALAAADSLAAAAEARAAKAEARAAKADARAGALARTLADAARELAALRDLLR